MSTGFAKVGRPTEGKSEKKDTSGYISRLKAERRPVKNVRYAISLLESFSPEPVTSLSTAQDFVSWCASSRRLSPQSVNSVVTTLSSYYDYLTTRGRVVSNPFILVDRPKVGTILPKNIPDEDQMEKILFQLSQFLQDRESLRDAKRRYRVHVVVEFLYGTGVRISEASSVRVADIDLESRTVRIIDAKSRKERICPFAEHTAAVLVRYLSLRQGILKKPDSPLLFGSSGNLSIVVNDELKAVSSRLGIDRITCHSFRHAYAYHMLKSGCDIRKIQDLLGHSNLSSTQVYAKVDTESLKLILDRFHPRNLKTPPP